MANLTYYSANKFNDLCFGGTAISVPPVLYLGVSTTPTQKDGTGITEPTGDPSYARKPINNNKTEFSVSALGVLNNLKEIVFPEATINWGVVTHWFFSDASTGGNIWLQGELQSSRTVESQTTLTLPIGSLNNTFE